MSGSDALFVKMCGLRDAESAAAAVDARADALGFILAPSRRQVTARAVADIRRSVAAEVVALPPFVGVTVNATPRSIERDVEAAALDMIQLSGDEPVSILAEIDVPVIKALRFTASTSLDDAIREVDAWLSGPRAAERVIVEGHAEGSYGGSGARADWDFVARISERYPIVLAGGLDPDNVAEAIQTVRPRGVDVSSGTETDGEKDQAKIRAFARNARSAAERLIAKKGATHGSV
ncbi:MAG TPA: phosphoribosylanthranilate isomerase [Thermomicrobiales bacterium]|nr:phosphoribosylanthranilate isomerase [Thermomicrobiales bacterium]